MMNRRTLSGKVRKTVKIFSIIFIIFIIGVYLFLISPPGNFFIKKIVQQQLINLIDQPVFIGNISTNLINHIQIKNFIVGESYQQEQSLLAFKQLSIHYQTLGLFNKKIILKDVKIDRPRITILKDSSGYYNLPKKLFYSSRDSLQKSSERQLGYKLQFGSLKIINMDLNYFDQKDSINLILNDINFEGNSTTLSESFLGRLDIKNGNINWRNLNQRLDKLIVKFILAEDKFNLIGLTVKTDNLELNSSGGYILTEKVIESGKIFATLDLGLLNSLESSNSDNIFAGELLIQCNIDGSIAHPFGSINLGLNNGLVYNFPLNKFAANFTLNDNLLKMTTLSIETLSGKVESVGNLTREKDDFQYELNVSLQNFQLSQLLRRLYHQEKYDLQGRLSGNFQLKGAGINWKQYIAHGRIDFSQLSILSQPFKDIQTDFSFHKGRLDFKFRQNESQINLTGVINTDSTIQGKFEGHSSTVEPVASLANVPGLKGQFQFAGDLNGSIKSPFINMNFRFWDGQYQGWPLTKVEGAIAFEKNQLTISNLFASGHSSDLQKVAQFLPVDSLAGVIDYQISASGNLDRLNANAKLSWKDGQINSINFDNSEVEIKTSGSEVFIERFDFKKNHTSISILGHLNYAQGILANLNISLFEIDSSAQKSKSQGFLTIAGKLYQESLKAEIHGNDIALLPILQSVNNVDEYINGTLNFDSNIYGNLNHPDFDLSWNLNHLDYKNKSLDSLNGKLYYKNNHLSVSEITAIKENSKFTVKGELPFNLYQATFLSSSTPFIQIEADNFGLNLLEPFVKDSILIDGKLSARLNFRGTLEEPLVQGELKIDNGQLITPYFSEIDSIYVNTFFFDEKIQLKQLNGKINKYHFTFEGEGYYATKERYEATLVGSFSQIGQIKIAGTSHTDHKIFGQLRIDNLNLNNLVRVTPINTQLQGLVNVSVDVSGTQDSPLVLLNINSDQIGIEKVTLDSLKISTHYDKNILNIRESGFKVNNGQILFKGSIPINFPQRDSSSFILTNINLESYANDLDIAWLRPLIPGVVNLQGKVHYDMKITGSLEDPVINGSFNLKDGVVKLKNIIPEISAMNAVIDFDRNKITIDKIAGKLEPGSFNLNGQTRLNGRMFADTKFALNLDKMKMSSPKIFSVNIETGEVGLSQIEDRFTLKGNIQLTEAKYIQDYKPQISRILTQIPNRPQADKNELLNKVLLDVIIQSQENIWVENNLAKLQMTSNLNLFGTIAQPNISGRVVINKGYVLYLDRKFKITNGLIDFTDPHRINPFIDITAICTVTDYQSVKEQKYTITLKLSGLLEKPDFMLVSEPQLDKADIIAILTVGRTRESLFPQSESAQGYSFQQIMLDRFKEITSQRIAGITEQKLSRTLSLENISIEGNLFQLDKSWGPRVTATKQLSDRVNITYSTVVGHANEQQIKLGYQLYKYLSIVGNTGQRGQSGLDLKFQFKFY